MTRLVRVDQVAEQIRGVTFAKADSFGVSGPGLIPVLTASNITELGVDLNKLQFVDRSKAGDRQMLHVNDVVVTASSGSINVVGRAIRVVNPIKATFGAFCKVLRPGPDIDPSYFAHYFRTAEYRIRITTVAAGANINNIRSEDLDGLAIPLPSLSEQRRIASILDQVDELRAKRRRTIRLFESQIQAYVAKETAEFGVVELGALIESAANGIYRPSSDYGAGTRILRIADYSPGESVGSGNILQRVDVESDLIEKFSLVPGDVVINRVNALSHLGKAALVSSLDEPTVFESNMMRLRLRSSGISSRLLVKVLGTPRLRSQIINKAKTAINQSSINQSDVAALQVPDVPRSAAAEIESGLDELEGRLLTGVQHLAKLNELFASLQHRAFRGEL